MSSIVTALIGALGGGALAVLAQWIAYGRGRRDAQVRDARTERDRINGDIGEVRTTLSYHGGLLEMICQRFGMATPPHEDDEEEKVRRGRR